MLFELFLGFFTLLQGGPAYAVLLVTFFGCGIGMPLSQDLLLMAAADLTRAGLLEPLRVMVVAWVGLMAGDVLTFWTGRYFGARWVRRPWAHRFVPPASLPRLEAATRRWGPVLAFVMRFLPGQRATLGFVYGTLRMPWWQFVVFDAVAALVQVPFMVYGVRAWGWRWQAWQDPLDNIDNVLTLALIVLVVVWWRRQRPAIPSRGVPPA